MGKFNKDACNTKSLLRMRIQSLEEKAAFCLMMAELAHAEYIELRMAVVDADLALNEAKNTLEKLQSIKQI